jgi:hypothetical protein
MWYNTRMKKNKMTEKQFEDLLQAALEAQEAKWEAEGMMDAPDSFQIKGIKEEDLEDNSGQDTQPVV